MKPSKRSSFAVAVAALAMSLIAPAASGEPYGDPDPQPTPTNQPNLVLTALSVTAPTTTQWEVAYTVGNYGGKASYASTTQIRDNGSRVLGNWGTPALSPGATSSNRVRVARNGCYIAVQAVTNANNWWTNGSSNSRWAVGLSSASCSSAPSYRVKATSLKAYDESHWDSAGSDEPYLVFSSVGGAGTARTTTSRVFGDVDSGETRTFGSTEGCIWTSSCGSGRAVSGIGISIQLWEHDYGDQSEIRANTAEAFGYAGTVADWADAPTWAKKSIYYLGKAVDTMMGWAQDDFMASSTLTLTPERLAERLRSAGSSYTSGVTLCCGDEAAGANYYLSYQVTRVS